MVATLEANSLSLGDVRRLLRFEERLEEQISSRLLLEPLTELEQQELQQIRQLFHSYYQSGKIDEGQVKFLFLAPLLRLAGFYEPEIRIILEENIAAIEIPNEEIEIKGRMDILAVNKNLQETTNTSLWILVIESKNSQIEAMEGLPQLLTYAYTSLKTQASVWGLATNGMRYQFVYVESGDPPQYQLFPDLSLIYPEPSRQLLQVLKAICKIEE